MLRGGPPSSSGARPPTLDLKGHPAGKAVLGTPLWLPLHRAKLVSTVGASAFAVPPAWHPLFRSSPRLLPWSHLLLSHSTEDNSVIRCAGPPPCPASAARVLGATPSSSPLCPAPGCPGPSRLLMAASSRRCSPSPLCLPPHLALRSRAPISAPQHRTTGPASPAAPSALWSRHPALPGTEWAEPPQAWLENEAGEEDTSRLLRTLPVTEESHSDRSRNPCGPAGSHVKMPRVLEPERGGV